MGLGFVEFDLQHSVILFYFSRLEVRDGTLVDDIGSQVTTIASKVCFQLIFLWFVNP